MPITGSSPRSNSNVTTTVLLILPYFALVFIVLKQNELAFNANLFSFSSSIPYDPTNTVQQRQLFNVGGDGTSSGWDPHNPLAIPRGEAQALPSIRVTAEQSVDNKRNFYGGAGDKAHLGGFTEFDTDGISPNAWKNMITKYGIRSFLDVGCGRGTSTSWFLYHGAKVRCVEGSHDAVEKTFLPDPNTQLTEHDFSRGPWWPQDTYDAAWAVEFLEHVGVNYHFNYITAFRKAALIFVTSSRWGGWHHVEVHDDPWWIQKYESYGFRYSPEMSQEVREWARRETGIGPHGKKYRAQHIFTSMKVFINPAVAALPQHAHLFPELGCYVERKEGKLVHRECGVGKQKDVESKLPDSYKPIELTEEMDNKWLELIRSKLDVEKIA